MVDTKSAPEPEFIYPDWPAPDNIKAAATTRIGGFSEAPLDSFNLGLHVNDDPVLVNRNRDLMAESLSLPGIPVYLNQVHGTDAICADDFSGVSGTEAPAADACWSADNNVIAIMTADCLPVLFASKCGSVIGGAHAGWRGLADGVIEKTVEALPVESSELIAWLGPAIGPRKFEVGSEVRERFVDQNQPSDRHFVLNDSKKYLADLYGLAKDRLAAAGVESIYGGGFCTHSESHRFFSHRRDQGLTGRMAALIWKV